MIRDWWSLIRGFNALLAGAAAWVGMVLATGTWFSSQMILAILPPMLITGAGNIDNDLCDLEIDRRIKPWRPLASLRVSGRAARVAAVLLMLSGLMVALLGGLWPLLIATTVVAFLGLYNHRFSSWPIVGNIVVAGLGALPIMFGATVTLRMGREINLDPPMIAAVIAFWLHLPRELLKDTLDSAGDREAGRETLATIYGEGKPVRLAGALMLLALAYVAWSAFCGCFGTLYSIGVMLTIVPALLLGSAQCLFSPSLATASRWSFGLKLAMVGGLAWMFLGRVPVP